MLGVILRGPLNFLQWFSYILLAGTYVRNFRPKLEYTEKSQSFECRCNVCSWRVQEQRGLPNQAQLRPLVPMALPRPAAGQEGDLPNFMAWFWMERGATLMEILINLDMYQSIGILFPKKIQSSYWISIFFLVVLQFRYYCCLFSRQKFNFDVELIIYIRLVYLLFLLKTKLFEVRFLFFFYSKKSVR